MRNSAPFVFAVSGALAGVRHRLDSFGVLVLAYAAATAGGITRHLVIGAEPPASVADWRYIVRPVVAGLARFRTDLLSTVAHELRTPLTAVRTAIGLLLDRSVQPEPEMREQLLETISQSAERMQRLVTDVLDLTRSRLGGMSLQLRRFDAVALAREVAAPLQAVVASRQQTLRLEVPAGPVWVYGDHRRLEQALTNLVSNAHTFSPNGSPIRLTVSRHGTDVVWTVIDRGVGIALEDRPRLFERFFSSPTDAAGQRAGTGLGLPLALAIAQAHGGTIDVESALGQGSSFSLRVPVAGPPEEDEV